MSFAKLHFRVKLALKSLIIRTWDTASRVFGRSGSGLPIPRHDRGPLVVVMDELVPTPDRDAGSLRMLTLLKMMSAWSRVVFIQAFGRPDPRYESELHQAGIETVSVAYLSKLLSMRPRAVILSRPSVADAFIDRVGRTGPRLTIIFDMVDAHFVRLERESAIKDDPRLKEASERSKRLEIELATKADIVWSASSEDRRRLLELVPEARIEVVPTIHLLKSRGRSFDERRGLLFVGNLNHKPNLDAVIYLIQEILPLITEILPDVVLTIVGAGPSAEIEQYAADHVRILGYVPEIDQLLYNARVFVAPLRFGAGSKGKIGEAMSYGLPCVTTSMGAESMGLIDGENAMIKDGPHEFAEAVVRLYTNRQLWEKMSDKAYSHIEKNYVPQAFGTKVKASVLGL